MDETICGLMFRQNWWADWTILAVNVFQTFCLTNMFTQHETWMYHYDLLWIFHRIRIFTTSTHLAHFPEVKTWNSHSCWSFFFRCAIEQKFEITPRDIVQRTGVCRAHQSRHRFLFLGGKKICFKKQLRKWKIPGIQWRWTYFFMDLQETHKDHQMLTWKCLIKPSLHLIGGVLSPIISKHMCGSTALRS